MDVKSSNTASPVGGVVANRAVQVRTLAKDIALCSCASIHSGVLMVTSKLHAGSNAAMD